MCGKRLKIAVLISGNGSNLQALIDACKHPDYPAQITCVISNNAEAYGLTRAKTAGIPAQIIDHKNYRTREEFDDALLEILKPYQPDLICLAGFMRILTPVFINSYTGRILNTHPSLLPKFGGPGMYGNHVHEAVIKAGETISGCSIHEVITDVDKGTIICQETVPVLPDDTAETLAKRVIAQEHIAYPKAVALMAQRLKPQIA